MGHSESLDMKAIPNMRFSCISEPTALKSIEERSFVNDELSATYTTLYMIIKKKLTIFYTDENGQTIVFPYNI